MSRSVRGLPTAALTVVFAAALLAIPSRTHAQQSTPSTPAAAEMARRVPVTVALVDSYPYGSDAAAVILRRPEASSEDVIVLQSATANGQRLAAALLNLVALRERAGDTASTAGVFRVRKDRVPQGDALEREALTAGRVVARLRTTIPTAVPGVGQARATQIYLPSRGMREELKARGILRVGS